MLACALWQDQDEGQDGRRKHCRSERAAEIEPAFCDRLIEEIAYGRAERPGQDERRPEERDP